MSDFEIPAEVRHRDLIAEALRLWLPEANFIFERFSWNEKTGVEIVIVDVSGATSEIAPGKYILRAGPAADDLSHPNELATADAVRAAAPWFAEQHVPRLLRFHAMDVQGKRHLVSLLDLAGGSLRRYSAPTGQSTGLLRVAHRLAYEMLEAWARPNDVRRMPLREVLEATVGSRADACLAAAAELFPDGSVIHYENGRTFLNPAAILGSPDAAALPMMAAMCHRDLNAGNLHVPRDEVNDDNYWIMDIGQAADGLAGYDHAYLEVILIVDAAVKSGRTVLATCLEVVEGSGGPNTVPANTQWLAQFLTEMRVGITEWIARQPGREDDLRCQLMIMRMIAGLNWARRFAGRDAEKARFCVAYAGWYAQRLQLEFPDAARFTPAAPILAARPLPAGPADRAAGDRIWETFWGLVNGFSSRNARYVLVSEQLPREADLTALGQVPWSMVIDLDPESDRDGLYSMAEPLLSTHRAMHTVSVNKPIVDFTRGTAWLLAAGSSIRREPALPYREWIYQRLDTVRRMSVAFRSAVGDAPIVVVVLPGRTDAAQDRGRDKLMRVLDALDEVLRGRAAFVHVGLARVEPTVEVAEVQLAIDDFLSRLAGTLGQDPTQAEYRLPGAESGKVAIAPESMRVFQEHMDILHDTIHEWGADEVHEDEAFWRGGVIRWSDLHAGRDLPRTVNDRLSEQVAQSLTQHKTRTIILRHHPGAGGTTAALRVAWDLHDKYPVAVLRTGVLADASRIPLLAERLHRIFVLTEKPVLFLAESSDLSETYREALYRELATRSSRVTILYVRRMRADDNGERNSVEKQDGGLVVSEPLDAGETADFQYLYTQLTTSRARAEELALLGGAAYARYRTPFFYGLITFEREFTKISDYVRSHLENVRGPVQDVLEFVALATIYSNTGLQLELLQKLLNVPLGSALEPGDLIGPQAARLVTARLGRQRMLHQLLAEEVLAELLAGGSPDWQLQLGDLAMRFIRSIALATDPSTDPIRLLFRQVFLDRQVGRPDDAEDREDFAPLIEKLDKTDPALGHRVLKALTEFVPEEPHFWNHLGRHQMYKVKHDLNKAEEYLGNAVELAPDDHVHHHTLGLIRRSQMREKLRYAERHGLTQVMGAVDEWFYRTEECFVRARDLNPEDIYGYITHIQTIIDVARSLRRTANVSSVAELTSDAAEWIENYLTTANELLDVTMQLYNTLERRDDYLNDCLAKISQLYGDLDSVIQLWEVAASGPRNSPMSRRALAQAYYVRGNRTWRDLSQPELERVVELANQNLAYRGAKEEDYRLWFEAYKLLPDFEIDEALARLQQWSARFPSWRAQYYRFSLLFHLWFTGRSDDVDALRGAQQKALELMLGRSKRSYLWLARGPETCPLIAESDLGGWDRQQDFWRETGLLQRVNGTIDYMDGPQAGQIELEHRVGAFFVPRAGGFLSQNYEGTQVNFFLGLSPEGLRAWDVRRGSRESAVWARQSVPRPRARLVSRPGRPVDGVTAVRLAETAERRKLLEFCSAFLQAQHQVGIEPPLSRVAARVSSLFRAEMSAEELRALLRELPDLHIGSGEDPTVRLGDARPAVRRDAEEEAAPGLGRITFLQPEHRNAMVELDGEGRIQIAFDDIKNLSDGAVPVRGQLVRLTISQGARGPVARAIELLSTTISLVDGELIEAVDLPRRLEEELREELENRRANGEESFGVGELESWAGERFAGAGPVAERMGKPTFGKFLGALPWLVIGDYGHRFKLKKRTVFGRLEESAAGSKKAGNQTSHRRSGEPPASRQNLDELLWSLLNSLDAAGRPATLQTVGNELTQMLGPKRYKAILGGRKLSAVLAERPQWQLIEDETTADTLLLSPTPVASLDIDALLDGVMVALAAAGRRPNMQNVGSGLREVLGEQRYQDLRAGRKLSEVVADRPGWQLTDDAESPDTLLLSRVDP